MPRELLPHERAALDRLLSLDFQGVRELRLQAATAQAECTGLIVNLVVDAVLPIAQVAKRTPVQAVVDGSGYDGGLLLFVDDGRLSALEYWWVTEDAPDEFPPLEAIGRAILG
jgi:hypothetical protein